MALECFKTLRRTSLKLPFLDSDSYSYNIVYRKEGGEERKEKPLPSVKRSTLGAGIAADGQGDDKVERKSRSESFDNGH